MVKKLINAPHLKDQQDDFFSDLIVLAGHNSWSIWDKGKGQGWLFLCEYVLKQDAKEKPIIIDEKQLADISNVRIANQKQRFIKMIKCGELSQVEITAICCNLAKNTDVTAVSLCDITGELIENLTPYINRLRNDDSFDKIIANSETQSPKIKENDRTSEKAKAFREWLGLDIALQRGSREIYHYDSKLWAKLDDDDLEEKMVLFLEENNIGYSDRTITSLVNTLKTQLPRMEEQKKELLAFNNGVLNRNTLLFQPHNRENWLTALIPHNYTQEFEKTPIFDKWLDFISNGDLNKQHNILAAFYAILTNRYNWQLFFEITGVGGSGKSVFGQLATLLAGEKNTETGRLIDLDEPRGRETYKDKTLIICPEQPRYGGDGSGLKNISGGDALQIDPKNKTRFKTIIPAIVLIINNEPTKFTERCGGVDRRRVIFSFNRTVQEKDRDPYFFDKIEKEIGGIIYKVLHTFKDEGKARQALQNQKNSNEALLIKIKSDHITAFCSYLETTEETNGLFIGNASMMNNYRTHLYPAYLAYTEANNIKNTLTLNNFSESLSQGLAQNKCKFPYKSKRTKEGFRSNVIFKNFDDFFNDYIKRNI